MDLGLEALSKITIFSKYAKYIPELKRRETWDEIVDRYVDMMVKKYPSQKETKTKKPCPIQIYCKNFHVDTDGDIFKHCSMILSQVRDGTYAYNTDGLIFTPANTGVGSDKVGSAAPLDRKCTWNASFKWKPAQYNTIEDRKSTRLNSSH